MLCLGLALRVLQRLAPIEISCQEYGPSSQNRAYRSRRHESNQKIEAILDSSLIISSLIRVEGTSFWIPQHSYGVCWCESKGFPAIWCRGLPLPWPVPKQGLRNIQLPASGRVMQQGLVLGDPHTAVFPVSDICKMNECSASSYRSFSKEQGSCCNGGHFYMWSHGFQSTTWWRLVILTTLTGFVCTCNCQCCRVGGGLCRKFWNSRSSLEFRLKNNKLVSCLRVSLNTSRIRSFFPLLAGVINFVISVFGLWEVPTVAAADSILYFVLDDMIYSVLWFVITTFNCCTLFLDNPPPQIICITTLAFLYQWKETKVIFFGLSTV